MGSSRERAGKRLTVIGATLGLMAATAFGVAIFLGSTPPERGFQPLGFPLLWAAPALLALLSLRERPVLLVSAAVVSFLLSFTALSGVTLVLVIPTVCYGVAYHRGRHYPLTLTRPLLAVVLPVLACAGALGALVARPDPVCWTYTEGATENRTYTRTACGSNAEMSFPATTFATERDAGTGSGLEPPPGSTESAGAGDGVRSGGGSTSDTVTAIEAAASAGLIATGLASGWVIARPGGGQAERRLPRPPRRPTDRR